jgi:hypothetical protein
METITATQPGPIQVDLRTNSGDIIVIASKEITTTRVEIEGDANISTRDNGARLHVTANSIVVSGGGNVVIGGRRYGSGTYVAGDCYTSDPVTITAHVPTGSSVSASTQSGEISTEGALANVEAGSQSGRINVALADTADVRSQSGSVTIRSLAGDGRASSMSGDVTVHATTSCHVKVETMSGDVTVTSSPGARPQISARSMSGRTTIR